MSISLPDNLHEFVLDQVAKGGYGSVHDYIRELVRRQTAGLPSGEHAGIPRAFRAGFGETTTNAGCLLLRWSLWR